MSGAMELLFLDSFMELGWVEESAIDPTIIELRVAGRWDAWPISSLGNFVGAVARGSSIVRGAPILRPNYQRRGWIRPQILRFVVPKTLFTLSGSDSRTVIGEAKKEGAAVVPVCSGPYLRRRNRRWEKEKKTCRKDPPKG